MAVRLHLSGGHLCSGPGEPSLCLVAASCVRDASPESSTNIQSVSECGFGRNGSDDHRNELRGKQRDRPGAFNGNGATRTNWSRKRILAAGPNGGETGKCGVTVGRPAKK